MHVEGVMHVDKNQLFWLISSVINIAGCAGPIIEGMRRKKDWFNRQFHDFWKQLRLNKVLQYYGTTTNIYMSNSTHVYCYNTYKLIHL